MDLVLPGIEVIQLMNVSQWGGSAFSSENMGVILQLEVPGKVGGSSSDI